MDLAVIAQLDRRCRNARRTNACAAIPSARSGPNRPSVLRSPRRAASRDAFGRPVEQRHRHLALERSNAAGKRRLRDVQRLRGAGEVSMLSECQGIAEKAQLDQDASSVSLSFVRGIGRIGSKMQDCAAAGCSTPAVQDRAYTSPIWYHPT
jgi:hypothetical protein